MSYKRCTQSQDCKHTFNQKRHFSLASYARNNRSYVEKLAGRFAAKEAVLKLLGTGWRGKIAWTDIEIVNAPSGQPQVKLSGEVKIIAHKLRIDQIAVSITHTANFAIASAVALSGKR